MIRPSAIVKPRNGFAKPRHPPELVRHGTHIPSHSADSSTLSTGIPAVAATETSERASIQCDLRRRNWIRHRDRCEEDRLSESRRHTLSGIGTWRTHRPPHPADAANDHQCHRPEAKEHRSSQGGWHIRSETTRLQSGESRPPHGRGRQYLRASRSRKASRSVQKQWQRHTARRQRRIRQT